MIKNISLFLFTFGIALRFSGGAIPFVSPIALVILAVFVELFGKKNPVLLMKLPSRGFFFLLLIGLSLIYSKSPEYGMIKFGVLGLWVFAFSIMSNNIMKNISLFVKYLSLSLILIVVLFYYYFGSPFSLINEVYTFFRLQDEETNPNSYARFLGLGVLSVLIGHKFVMSKLLRIGLYVVVVISLLYMFLAGSKGPMISLAAGSLIYYFFFRSKYYKIGITLAILIGMFILNLDSLFRSTNSVGDFVNERFIDYGGSLEGRNDRYLLVFNRFGESAVNEPFALMFGNGIGSFSYYYDGRDMRSYPHNIFMEVIFEIGFVGLFLFLFLVLVPIFKLWRHGIHNIDNTQQIFFIFWVYTFLTAQVSSDLAGNFLLFGFSILLINYGADKNISLPHHNSPFYEN